ncbi:MAG TPA: NAD(P)H-binding protein [Vicinamibacterales bacterium]|nr:NAD(P)H-binding protein [Vicinamibacterales bacterium]
MIVLITGAAGNLGGLLARHLLPSGHELRLMYHRTPLAADLVAASNVRPVKADLADPSTLQPAFDGADVVGHFAGRLFAPRPETFLPETNTRWFSNLTTAAIRAKGRTHDPRIVSSGRRLHVSRTAGYRPSRSNTDLRSRAHAPGRRTIPVRADTRHVDYACRAAIGNHLRARHSDGRCAVAGAKAIALCMAQAHAAPVAGGARFSARDRGGHQQPRHSWESADWSASWRRTHVSEDEWRQRITELRTEAARWLDVVRTPRDVDEIELNALVGSIAHLAYHLGGPVESQVDSRKSIVGKEVTCSE